MAIPATLITGWLGAGKTTAILGLLARRPEGERWAVLVNEFGEIGIDGATIDAAADGVAVREIAGGCVCCAAQTQLRVGLTRLLREARPDRLLIEASGLGHPAGVIDALRDPWLARAIDLRTVLCLADIRQFLDPRSAQVDIYRDQLTLADVLVGSKADLASDAQRAAFRSRAGQLYPPKFAVLEAVRGNLDPAVLDLVTGVAPSSISSHGHEPRATGTVEAMSWGWRYIGAGQGHVTRGWRFPPQAVFDCAVLGNWLRALSADSAVVRAKGAMRTGGDWQLLNCFDGEVATRAIAWRRDSRIEVIVRDEPTRDWALVEAGLLAASRN